MVPVVGNEGDHLAIVPSKHSNHRCATLRLKGNAIIDTEFEHLSVCAHVIEEAKALDDAIVQIDEFCLGQFVNVWSLVTSASSRG